MIAQTLIASIAFIALLPLFLVISIKILLEGRPVIYSQIRVGSFGKLFRIYKFRTMKQDAEKLGPFICQDYEDPRITKFGKFLRKSKLDELPQLINIIKNEMSFVGPRPERPVFHEKFKFSVRSWENRLFVRPGITGYAQVNRRINHDPNDKIIEDLKYIKEQSFITDIKIILKTLVALLDGKPI
ncbi:UNVERIFIED_CONTAM: hypothetical protein GTU68_035784 [Idotea baltica]|nr:hypothetical protein [Idotea baltica]